jgi:hypothetical protein
MTVRHLATTCSEDTTWRSNFRGQDEQNHKIPSKVLVGAISSDLEVVSSAPKEI